MRASTRPEFHDGWTIECRETFAEQVASLLDSLEWGLVFCTGSGTPSYLAWKSSFVLEALVWSLWDLIFLIPPPWSHFSIVQLGGLC